MKTEVSSSPERRQSRLVERLSCEFVEITGELRISGTVSELLAEMLPGEPPSAAAMGHDVSDGLAMDGQRDSFAGLDRVDHLTRPVAQIPYSDLHVRQCSTWLLPRARS